jgi:hypothetical protein
MTVVGPAGPGGPLEDLVIQQGRWAQRPGELVLSADFGVAVPLGTQLAAGGVPGTPRLTVVGYASSINQSARTSGVNRDTRRDVLRCGSTAVSKWKVEHQRCCRNR